MKRMILLFSIALCSTAAFAQVTSPAAKVFQRWEGTISTAKSYAACNPSRDAVLTVTYTAPDNVTQYTGYGFWDGPDPANPARTIFRLRSMFPQAGQWKWTTLFNGGACGSDAALGISTAQTVDVTASGVNQVAIYTQGPLKVNAPAPPQRYLTYNNGLPFYWLGDTAWRFLKASPADWTTYLAKRKSQGFTVIQVAVPTSETGQPTDYAGRTPFTTSGTCPILPAGCGTMRYDFWRDFDAKIQQANNSGFVVVVIGLYKRVIEKDSFGTQLHWPALADSQWYTRAVVSRLSGNHVIFSPGFDELPNRTPYCEDSIAATPCTDTDPRGISCTVSICPTGRVNQACRAKQIALTIRNSWIRHITTGAKLHGLVTHHIGGGCGPCPGVSCNSDYYLAKFAAESWLDFTLFQSGQGASCNLPTQMDCVAFRARQRPRTLYALNGKPLADGEGPYDNFGAAPYNDVTVRQVGYLSTLSGAFGYTFGVAGIWDWGAGTPPSTGWDSPSSTQMKHMCTLFRNLEWQNLVPEDKIVNQSAVEPAKMVYARDGVAGSFALAFLPVDSSTTFVQINTSGLTSFPSGWCSQWMDPSNGAYTPATPVPAGGTNYNFTKPNAGKDWVLVLKGGGVSCTPTKYCPCSTVSGGQFVCATTP